MTLLGIFPRILFFIAAAALMAAEPARAQPRDPHPITIDDVLDMTRIDRVELSPDGAWAAVAVQRPARPGEVYGRTAYEVDPSRSDIWLISMRGGERRNLTQGAQSAAGFWCPSWSPDGTYLAMLSTRPEGNEPRGGDNVRLYVWNRVTGALSRASETAMLTQTRYGSPLYQVDLRGGGTGAATRRCSGEENAPFLWLDARTLLAVMLPPGVTSGLIDEYARPARHARQVLEAIRAGEAPTMTEASSGGARRHWEAPSSAAVLNRIDVSSGMATPLAEVPHYPFRGELSVVVSPDGRHAALLAPTGAISPAANERVASAEETWLAEKRLGFLDLADQAPVRWAALPQAARYPLELFDWSPAGRHVAFRARGGLSDAVTPLYVASPRQPAPRRISPPGVSVGGDMAGTAYPRDLTVHWTDENRLLVRFAPPEPGQNRRQDWWILPLRGEAVNVTRDMADPPAALRRTATGAFLTVQGGNLVTLEPGTDALRARATPLGAEGATIVWPVEPRAPVSRLIVAFGPAEGRRPYSLLPVDRPGGAALFTLPQAAELAAVDPNGRYLVSSERSLTGLELSQHVAGGDVQPLLSLDRHLASVDWGRRMLIEYRGEDGNSLRAGVILPPGYREGRRYPVIVWVYPGYQVRSLNSYFLDPFLPGIYNLQLYAARGYVVLIPSLPVAAGGSESGLPALSSNTIAAVDRLAELGIADPERVGVMGQSHGGFGTYALVTQTDRFAAAVAMAGNTDLGAFYGQFSPLARGYPGIEHEMSYNWVLAETGQVGLGVPPHEDHDRYWRQSPLAYVDRVQTPLLLIHGEYDKRAPLSQAESFFYALYRRGRTARLLRYWGESHSLAQSPANVRSIYAEILAWFDTYLGPAQVESGTPRQGAAPGR